MICIHCDCEEFKREPRNIRQHYKGAIFDTLVPASVCIKCGWVTVANDQVDELIKKAKEMYEETKHRPV